MRAPTLALIFLGWLAAPAFAADAPSPIPAPNPATIQYNRGIVAATRGAADVFTVQDDGAIRHVQSGLICPAEYPNAEFYQALVYATDGSDIGCDYRRADKLGGAWAKLTIFAVKAKSSDTLDAVFAHYRGEVEQTYPQAVFQGDALTLDSKGKPSALPAFRSAEYVMPFNGQTYTTQLYVVLVQGWTIEVRCTFVGLPNAVDAAREGADSAVLEAGDRLMGPKALFDALGSVRQ